jgi:hypothetical protein
MCAGLHVLRRPAWPQFGAIGCYWLSLIAGLLASWQYSAGPSLLVQVLNNIDRLVLGFHGADSACHHGGWLSQPLSVVAGVCCTQPLLGPDCDQRTVETPAYFVHNSSKSWWL